MPMRSLMAGLIVFTTLLGQPATGSARETTQGEEAALALAALGLDLVYVPAKVVVAAGGLLLGAVIGLATGGDVRSAYAFWVPSATGTFIVRAANMDGSEPIDFFGADYTDQASPVAQTESGDGGTFYQSLYR